MEFKDYLKKVKNAANIVDLELIEDDYLYEFADKATAAQRKQFEAAVTAKRKELVPTREVGEFEVTTVPAKVAAPKRPAHAAAPRRGKVSPATGANYVITTPQSSPPFTLPEIDFPIGGDWKAVGKDNIGYINPQLVNIPPKDWSFYIPHIEGGKLMETEIQRRSEVSHLYTLLKNYMIEGGTSYLNAIYRTRNKNYILDVNGSEITKVETMVFLADEPSIMTRKIFSFWGVQNGVLKPVPIVVIE